MQTTVVNIKKGPCDVYIGRPSKFGNPFVIGRDGSREDVIRKFSKYFKRKLNDKAFHASVMALRGKSLGCYCAPSHCHGHVIARYLNS